MEENKLEISKELLDSLSAEELVDLKLEVEELLTKIDNVIETCDEALNS